jgi:hypothetical protein
LCVSVSVARANFKRGGIEYKTMTNSQRIARQASRIADAIVELVERTDGLVPLTQLHSDIPGFAKEGADGWEYYLERDDGETVIWVGMSEVGVEGLCKAISERRIAIQLLANPLLYLVAWGYPKCENWLPVVLLPAKAANLDTPKWRMRASPAYQKRCMEEAAATGEPGYRLLTPGPVRCTADQFSV